MRVLPKDIHGVDPALLHAELDMLDALPVVKGPAKLDPKFNGGTGRVICNLWCSAHHVQKDKQPCVPLNKKPSTDASAVPNYLVATQRLISKIETEHAGCLAAAEAARANSGAAAPHPAAGMCASVSHSHAPFAPSEGMPSRTRTSALACARLAAAAPPLTLLTNAFTPSFHVVCPSASASTAGSSSEGPSGSDVLAAMMQLEAARSRAETANEASLVAQKAHEAAEAEVERLRNVLEPKRQRVEAVAAEPAAAAAHQYALTNAFAATFPL